MWKRGSHNFLSKFLCSFYKKKKLKSIIGINKIRNMHKNLNLHKNMFHWTRELEVHNFIMICIFLILKTCIFHFTSKYNWSLVSIKFNEQMKDIFRHFLWSIDYLRKCTISAVVRYIICDEVRSILSISAKSQVLLLRNNSETTNHVSFYCY